MMKYEINSSKYVGIEPEPVNSEFTQLDMMMPLEKLFWMLW